MQPIDTRNSTSLQMLPSAGTVNTELLVTVADIMVPANIFVPPSMYLYEVLHTMQRQHVQCLIVEPLLPIGAWGIIALRDVQTMIAACSPELPRVRHVMIMPPFVVAPKMRIEDCSTLMLTTGVRRVVVVQKQQPVGIISDSDIFQAIEARS